MTPSTSPGQADKPENIDLNEIREFTRFPYGRTGTRTSNRTVSRGISHINALLAEVKRQGEEIVDCRNNTLEEAAEAFKSVEAIAQAQDIVGGGPNNLKLLTTYAQIIARGFRRMKEKP